jgi:hypothetical protein
MSASDAGNGEGTRWYDQWMEFALVLVLLFVMWLLVNLVLRSPTPSSGSGTSALTGKDVLAYRSGLMTALLGTFGAWIGAGAAYFFGSKNLKRTTDAIARAQTGQQRLSTIKLNEMDPPPQPITAKVALDDPLSKVDHILEDPNQWWFCVLNKDGTLQTVMHEESYYRFHMEKLTPGSVMTKEKFEHIAVSDLVDWAKGQEGWNWVLYSIYVPVSMAMTAAAVNEAMMAKQVSIAIVVDENKKPTHYVGGGELKAALEKC